MTAPAQGPRPTAGAARRAGAGRWLAAGLGLLLLAVGATGVHAWRQQQLVGRIRAALPPPPELAGWPPELGERLAAAQAQARSARARTALAGVAELGRLYHANAFFAEAERCWRLLRAAQPGEARWCYYLSDLRRTAGDDGEMFGFMAEAAKLAPGYSAVWLHLADMQLKLGQLEAARRDYERRLALLPGDRYARLGLTRVALQQGRRADARTLIEQLVKDAPEFSSAHNLFAELLAAAGDSAAADRERWLGRNTVRFREAADPWLDELGDWCYDYERVCVLGDIESQTRHYDRARTFYQRAIQLRPGDPSAYELAGAMELKAEDPARARDILERALARLPPGKPTIMTYVDLAHAYRLLKQPGEAVRVIRLGIERLGDQYEFDDALGVALGDLGRHEESVAALRTAVAKSPNDANANYNLAVALLAVRRLDEAIPALRRSLALKPTFPEALALLAQIEMDSGRWQEAMQYLQPLFESRPEMPQARQLMALWHLIAGAEAEKQHDLAEAAQHYRAGLNILPNHPELQMRYGTLCLVQGQFADAITALEAYHRSEPGNPTSAFFLGQAYAGAGRRDEARKVLTEGAELADRMGNATTAQYCREILRQL